MRYRILDTGKYKKYQIQYKKWWWPLYLTDGTHSDSGRFYPTEYISIEEAERRISGMMMMEKMPPFKEKIVRIYESS